jgi:hypothetical protein
MINAPIKTDPYPIAVTATYNEVLPGQPREVTRTQVLQGQDSYHIGEPVASKLEFMLPISTAQIGAGIRWGVAEEKGVNVQSLGIAETPPREVGVPGGGEGHAMELFAISSLPPGNSQIVFALRANDLTLHDLATKTVNMSGTYF